MGVKMSTQSNIENTLKDLHILLAKSEKYALDERKIVVEKARVISLLKELTTYVSDAMDEYQLTKQSRDKAERDFQRQSEQIIKDANKKAEDIYAASIMYTGESLRRVNGIIDETNTTISKIYMEMTKKLKAQEKVIKENQLELASELQDLHDTDKYLKLLEQRNKEIEKEKKLEEKNERTETSIYANRQTEIKVNEDYFEKMGIALEQEAEKEMEQTLFKDIESDVKVNLDAEYFKWKDGKTTENKNDVSKAKVERFQNMFKNLNRFN